MSRKTYRLIAAACLMVPGVVYGAPKGAHVERGQVQINRDGAITRITASNNAIISYRGFDILPKEHVIFVQPSASARVLNRINSSAPTRIEGALTANGRIYLVNPSGIFFGKGSVINVGAIYAAAGTISNADFLGGVNHFTGVSGSVSNEGSISGNAVALIGQAVANHGSIVTPEGGYVALAAGNDVYLAEPGSPIRVQIGSGGSGKPAQVENSGQVKSPHGRVLLGAGDLYSVVTHTGAIQGGDVEISSGKKGLTNVSGTIDASDASAGAKGGNVTITGDKIALEHAKIDASGDGGGGSIKIGGDFHGQGSIPTASRVFVSKDSLILADAYGAGDGGQVAVWSDEVTGFLGSIFARGGAISGNGGSVEVSGKKSLIYLGSVDLSAAHGMVGTLLLDPDVINLVSGSGFDDAEISDNQVLFADGGNATFTINTDSLMSQLSNADVLLQANIAINVTAGLATPGSGHILTLQTQPAGTINISPSADISLGSDSLVLIAGTINTPANAQISANAISVTGNVALAAGVTTFSGAGNISIPGAMDGPADLVIQSSGTVTLGTIGGATPVASVNVTPFGGGTGVPGTVSLNGNVTVTTSQRYANAVVVAADAVLTAPSSVDFASTVDGPANLTINSPGTVTFTGTVGSNTPLASLTTDAGGFTNVDGGIVTSSGDQTYNDAVALGADAIFTSTGGAIHFNGGLNPNGHTATINQTGGVLINTAGDVSGVFTSNTSSIDITADTIGENGGLTATAAGAVTLIATTGDITDATVTAGGGVTLSALNGSINNTQVTSTSPGQGLNVSVGLNFGVNESGGVGFDTLNFSGTNAGGGNITAPGGGNVGWGGGQTDLVLGSGNGSFPGKNFALSVGGFNTVTLGGPAGAAQVDSGRTFTLNTTTAAGDTTVLDNPVTASAAAFNVTAATNNLEVHSVSTTGDQNFTAAAGVIRLTDANDLTNGGDFTAHSPVLLAGAGSTLSTAGGTINLTDTVNGAATLALVPGAGGAANISGNVGGVTPLTSLTATGGTTNLNAGLIHTTGAQTLNTAVVLQSDANLVGSDITSSQSMDGAHALSVNPTGTLTLAGSVGATTPLNQITVGNAGQTSLAAANIRTTGAQVYNNPVNMAADSLLTASDATLGQNVNGGHLLSIDATGTVTVSGDVGNAAPLSQTNFSGSTLILHNITTTGPQSYTGTNQIQLNSTYIGQNHTFDGPVQLAGAEATTTIQSTGTAPTDVVHFTGTIDAAAGATKNLQITASGQGSVTLDSAVGSANPLNSVFVTSGSGQLTAHDVNTTGSFAFSAGLPNVGQAYVAQRSNGQLGTISLNSVYNSGGKDIVVNVGVFFGNANPRVPNGSNVDETHVPSASPIFKTDGDLTFLTRGGNFVMGQNQKISVAHGSLLINTKGSSGDGDAILGDLSASAGHGGAGNITVDTGAGDIFLLKRQAAPATTTDVHGNIVTIRDRGLDFVAGGRIIFRTHAIRLAGNSPLPKFASFEDGSSVPGFNVGKIPAPPTIEPATGAVNGTGEIVQGVTDLTVVGADFGNGGGGVTQPVTIVQLPAGVEGGEVGTEEELAGETAGTSLTSTGSELSLLGIEPRAVTAEELADEQLTGRALYNDIPARALTASDSVRVASPRLDYTFTSQAVATYRSIFGPPDADRSEEVRKTLKQAIEEYHKAHPAGDVSFNAFLESTPSESAALAIVSNLRKLAGEIRDSGLSRAEAERAIGRVVAKATPEGTKPAELMRLAL